MATRQAAQNDHWSRFLGRVGNLVVDPALLHLTSRTHGERQSIGVAREEGRTVQETTQKADGQCLINALVLRVSVHFVNISTEKNVA
ncbi:hypothetical protein [Deinococcus ruber]|uniref:hypothetical protein n=1 Tax=Deinococcus ruber TaxID=1848197 RepID=UPI00166D0646|nr:hypothetical protein [Deinococcus ruber]